ncbi:ABC transporter ATP-binding protein [Limnochorda pilosa]|uniref:Macrolide ABC transporter ATP-binding protein n=1 Tax=Limnochorda pilosa TaxID=1555112 RepID=A0A0K2SHZ2_LIMPI|nr:ABC transporter ATP-binding protein [Limnochorda pilosa]BAS26469.1 macrolide ABC transporter ATP-binding protein [Limnochorda pilosa]
MALVELEKVTKTYRQGQVVVEAVKGVDLQIESGEFTAIAGPSGSGKTTLLNLIGCLDTATEGSVRVAGLELSSLNRNQLADIRRQRIGFVFQSFNLIPVLTARENVEFALAMVDHKGDRDRVAAILAEVGLAGLEDRRPGELSGGQQQRVAIARALVKSPDLVLADEPTANLDSENGKAVVELMREINRGQGTTFVFSTHDPMVMAYSRRLVTLRDGRVATDERRDHDAVPREAGRA